jgi:hypothetical protein
MDTNKIGGIMRWMCSIILLFALSTCTKFGKNISVTGRIYNPLTGDGVSGVTIRLYKGKFEPAEVLGNSSGSKNVKEVVTDENGLYKLEHLGGVFKDYYIQQRSTGYYELGWADDGSKGNKLIKKGKEITADYQLLDFGGLKLNIHNVNCMGATDTLILERMYLTDLNYTAFIPVRLSGCYDQDGTSAQVPSGNWRVKWTVIRNGIQNTSQTEFIINGAELYEYTINY